MKKATLPTLSILGVAALGAGFGLGGCDAPAPSGETSAREGSAAGSDSAAFRSALEQALGVPDPYLRAGKVAALLSSVGPESVPEVQRVLQQGTPRVDVAEFELLMRRWAAQDPRAATQWAIQLQDPRFRLSAIGIAVESWARSDPAEAVAGVTLAAQSADRDLGQTVQHALVRGWFHADRPGVEKYIRSLGTSVEQQRGFLSYALTLGQAEGSDAVMQWVESIPASDERYRRSAFRQVTTALAWSDPKAAERWCELQCEGPYGKALRSSIVRVRLHNGEDGAEVLEWVARAPDGQSQTHALRTGFEIWALRDRETALRWMEQKIAEGPEPWVRKLYGAYARQLSVISPARAIQWADRIEAEAAREEMLVRIARRWLRQDAAAAEAWLRQSSLSEKAREKARNLDLPDYLPEASAS